MKNNGLFFAIRQKKKVFVVASFLVPTSVSLFSWKNARYRFLFFGLIPFLLNLSPIIVLHADAYGPLSKDKDLEVIKEKKWSVEAGGMVGSLNGNLSSTTSPFPYLFLPSSSRADNLLLVAYFPISRKVSGSTNAGTFLVSYKLFKRFSIDFGVMGGIMIPLSKNPINFYYYSLSPTSGLLSDFVDEYPEGNVRTFNGPRIGFKYFFSDGVFKPFVSFHTSRNSLRTLLPLKVLTYGVGGRYEISESFYLDTSITRTSFEGSSALLQSRYEATSIGLELRAGYLF